MSAQNIEELKLKTQELMFSIIYHNRLEMSFLADDAIWFSGSALVHYSKSEMQAYLDQIAIEDVLDTPEVSFVVAEHMGEECISIVGDVTYNTKIRRNSHIVITFHAVWLSDGKQWKVKQLITSSKSVDDVTAGQQSEVRINDKLFLKSVPVGLICCLNDNALPVQVINEKALALMGYKSIVEYKHNAGNALFASIHPDDI